MKVKLTYFKPSGKYYSEGTYESREPHFWKMIEEVRAMLVAGNCPGLNDGAVVRNCFSTLVEGEDCPPHLVAFYAVDRLDESR